MMRPLWAAARLGVGGGILILLVARVGTDPFVDAFRMTTIWGLVAALGITALSTACCAWRWSLVAHSLGVDVSPSGALAAYYRSQLLNATLPGGVLGDVHRAVRHGRRVGDLGRSLRSVAWERFLGQLVQIAMTALLLLALPSPFRSRTLASVALLAASAVVGAIAVMVVRRIPLDGSKRVARVAADDLRSITHTRWTPLSIVVTSGVAALGHVVIFLIAVRTSGETASTDQLLPVALLVLLASALPMNIAGWGPREGMAAWAFSATGLSASQGVTSGVVYGVMALVATLPGLVVLAAGRRRRVVAGPVPHMEAAGHG
jgi:uncharacterized membrane protein YbhN (UPF0104 family)